MRNNIECISFISGYVDNDIMYPTFDGLLNLQKLHL